MKYYQMIQRENSMIISGNAGTDRRSTEDTTHMEEQAGFSDFDFSSFTNGFGGIEDIFDIFRRRIWIKKSKKRRS